MAMRNFDLNRWDGLAALWCLGATFSLYIAAMVLSIIAKSEGPYSAVVLYDTAFYLVIVGAIMFLAGVLLMYNNSNAAMSAGVVMDPSTRNIYLLLFFATLLSLVLYGVVPTFV